MSKRDRVKGFFLGTGEDPLGADVEIEVDAEGVEVRIGPMGSKRRPQPIVSTDPAVRRYQRTMNDQLRAQSYRNRKVTPALKVKRKPGVRGEWVECPDCHADRSHDCETCWGRGAVWKSY